MKLPSPEWWTRHETKTHFVTNSLLPACACNVRNSLYNPIKTTNDKSLVTCLKCLTHIRLRGKSDTMAEEEQV